MSLAPFSFVLFTLANFHYDGRACVGGVTDAIGAKENPAIRSATSTVTLLPAVAIVVHDTNFHSTHKVIDDIKGHGYGATLLSSIPLSDGKEEVNNVRSVKIRIDGMLFELATLFPSKFVLYLPSICFMNSANVSQQSTTSYQHFILHRQPFPSPYYPQTSLRFSIVHPSTKLQLADSTSFNFCLGTFHNCPPIPFSIPLRTFGPVC